MEGGRHVTNESQPENEQATLFPARGRVAGIDFGTVRLGIAVCDAGRMLSSPLENYTRRSVAADADRMRRLVKEEGLVGFVVGLPLHDSGEESQKSLEARRFGAWLTQVTSLPVAYQDERYTTAAADHYLELGQLTAKKRRERRDMLAAQLILTGYLDRTRITNKL